MQLAPGRGQGARRAGRRVRARERRRAPPPDADRLDGARQARALPRRRPRSRPTTSGRSSPRPCPGRSGRSPMPSASARPVGRSPSSSDCSRRPPEPVLLAVLHRRVRELLELGDRLAGGANARDRRGKAMGIASEFRAETLADRRGPGRPTSWPPRSTGCVGLDAMVKGAPGTSADEAQRRLAFSLWVMDHTTRRERRTA